MGVEVKNWLVGLCTVACAGGWLAPLPAARAAPPEDGVKRQEGPEQGNAGFRVRRSEAMQAQALAAAPPAAAYNAAIFKGAPAMAAPVFSWSGFYVGGHVGWGWRSTTVDDPFSVSAFPNSATGAPTRRFDSDGFLGGVQAGGNYQIGQVVVGTEINFSWADINGNRTDTLSVTGTIPLINLPSITSTETDTRTWTNRTDWLGTATIRIGYAWDRWLVYGKGGIAAAHNRYSFLDVDRSTSSSGGSAPFISVSTISATGSDTRAGWTVGGGIEWAFCNNWSATVEYNYLDLGNESVGMAGTSTLAIPPPFAGRTRAVSFTTDIEQTIQIVRFGVNYRFGVPPP